MSNRGSAPAIVILIIAAIALLVFIATRPKPTETWNDEVAARREIASLTTRLELFNVAVGIITLLGALTAPMLFAGFWPGMPTKRYLYPAIALCCVGVILLLLLALAPIWTPASVVFGFNPQVLRSTAVVSSAFFLNALAAGLICIPLIVGFLAYLLDRLIAQRWSPVSKAHHSTP